MDIVMTKASNWVKGLALFAMMVALVGSLAVAPGASAASSRVSPRADVGKISVVAVDPTGATDGIVGATVVVREYGSDVIVLKGQTDASGRFASYIAPGVYQVEVIADGFKPYTQDAKIVSGQNTSLVAPLEKDAAVAPTDN